MDAPARAADLRLQPYELHILHKTPDKALEKMKLLAEKLGATVIGEEDDLPIPEDIERGVFTNRVTWIGWPIMVIVLFVLLIWRW